jgi:hypothetical protein
MSRTYHLPGSIDVWFEVEDDGLGRGGRITAIELRRETLRPNPHPGMAYVTTGEERDGPDLTGEQMAQALDLVSDHTGDPDPGAWAIRKIEDDYGRVYLDERPA